jgi:ribosomal protein S18 acetylase RimI-like enzyme
MNTNIKICPCLIMSAVEQVSQGLAEVRRRCGSDMTDAIEIRPFVTADRPGLLALVRELQAFEGGLYDRMIPPGQIGDAYIEGLLAVCRQKDGRLLVAAASDALIGYMAVLLAETSDQASDEVAYTYAYVQDLAVTASHRGQGLGSRLLAVAEDLARTAGVRWIRLSVLAQNSNAIGVYDKAGFRPLFSIMEKPLNP